MPDFGTRMHVDLKRVVVFLVGLTAATVAIVVAAPNKKSSALDSFLDDVGVAPTTDTSVPADLKPNLNVVATVVDESTFTPESAAGSTAARPPVEVNPRSAHVDLASETARQFGELAQQIGQRARQPPMNQVFRRDAAVLPEDRDPADIVLRRTAALLADLETMPRASDLAALKKQLCELRERCNKTDPDSAEARRALFGEVCALRRQIAFSNPLLDFREILFLKRNGIGAGHMCDQYYGITQLPGGGIYVVTDSFGANPVVRDVLTNSVVGGGRLKGRTLPKTGSFLSPALSFDGARMAFAYVECEGDKGHRYHTDPNLGHWSEGWSYHVFSAAIDGTDLQMLTDGAWNDFSPCFLPNGRIAFISERRGGYLRCGRVCPTYTLYDMAPTGSDVRCLSFHETNEWSPSVTHDGMIAWTRWDYVDRHGCVAHHPWVITPDGRDPRPIHGNYSVRSLRADMETEVRAIPGSPRYVATAAPHHGQSFGSLVVIDPNVQDDDAMGPVKRLTPSVAFPESQGGARIYGHAWPLSENYYLCAGLAGRYGIYLIDAFGNKELICRDPVLNCLNPIPVKAQKVPPIVPEMSQRVAADKAAEAFVSVVNVYSSLKPWPENTRIKALRVYQILPLSVSSAAVSHATGLKIPQGNDSINLARAVLGTVSVEEDGSAHFVVPARKELYFQALDENGLAVTSMRSGAQFQPGERMTCQGCHEPKHRTPDHQAAAMPLALRRAPSRLEADVDGTNPFSYPRLVQPVLDKNCVACHAKNTDKAPPLDGTVAKSTTRTYMEPATDYYASYLSLASKYGFYSYPDYYRTTPGQFGARASKLYELLRKGHHDVKLSSEDFHRITVWLDSVSLFYGVYEKEGGQAQLRGEIARPTLE